MGGVCQSQDLRTQLSQEASGAKMILHNSTQVMESMTVLCASDRVHPPSKGGKY